MPRPKPRLVKPRDHHTIYLRVPLGLVSRLRQLAEDDGRSLNAWCIQQLEWCIRQLEHLAAIKEKGDA